ncbi:MAG: lysophospholipid acyltransferase family protein, partial [Desulfobulbia bacterium]
LSDGEFIVLFAEGTSSDGNTVLPFKSSLFGALELDNSQTCLQTVALAYTSLYGLPIGRRAMPLIAWYGEMEMLEHAWELLKAGPIDVHVKIEPPIFWENAGDRKKLARLTESQVRENLARMLHKRAT